MLYTPRVGRKKLNRERINITLPQGMAKELEEVARAAGKDRSRLIEEIATEFLAAAKTAKKPKR